MAALLDRGTADLDRQALQDQLDALQSEVGFSASPGQLTVALTSRRAHLPELIRLVGRVLRQPTLPAAGLEEVRQQALSSLAEQSKEPEAVLDNALDRHGNPYARGDVRYARTFDEQEADWKAISADRVKAYHDRFVSAAHGQ